MYSLRVGAPPPPPPKEKFWVRTCTELPTHANIFELQATDWNHKYK
jgi:hypothetical protein